ncbi:tight adherence protein B [Nocardioides aromaticivorans]|uniref:Tight adherence protein B n=1 Tax=Nocardioides aromaticivorans TaxID=200618 RepID=A0A7Y9ZNM2_9ACTN|nr:type II secretion system F family protein [Nocardioides aromaticivorans]NYI46886.1 tight adherence protein B [Nocardioides aromaticivorans]
MAARRPLLLLAATFAALTLPMGAASAEDGTIAHVESTGEGLRVLVNLPEGAQVDLSGVEATLDGEDLAATAVTASSGTDVKRTTVLAIDTSQSMARQGRFAAAKEAAATYLDTVPADVEVGIVTFDNDVAVALEPTTDRDAARTVVDGLRLAKDTLLYDGVVAAIDAAGTEGQRTILVLSDGADTGSSAAIDDVTDVVTVTRTLVDVVSLGQSGKALEPLSAMAKAGNGRVIESSGAALAEDFRAEADVLASQVLVTAPLPSGFDATQATVEVVLPTSDEPVIARALAPIQAASGSDGPAPSDPTAQLERPGGWDAPEWLLYAGVGVLGVGLVAVAMLLVPGRPGPMSIAERVEAYSTQVSRLDKPEKSPSEPVLEQAKAAAAGVLERNRGLNDNLTRRLTAAGSAFKPSEWLLLHVGVVIAAGILGLLVGRGSIVVGLIFVAIGAALPPFYLRLKAARRRRAFDDALPEVLQLISGALSAGLSLAQAVDTVVREGPEPIASEFKRVLVEARIGMPLEDAFDGVAERFQSKDFAWSVMAIRIQRQVGGNLAELLTTVASTMRERAYLRRQVRTLSAEGRLSAVILCGLPPLFALFLITTNPDFLRPLYADARGIAVSVFGVVWLSIGVFAMSRIVKVDV